MRRRRPSSATDHRPVAITHELPRIKVKAIIMCPLRHAIIAAMLALPIAGFTQTNPGPVNPAPSAPPSSSFLSPDLPRVDAARLDQRIKQLHDQLGITSAEQPQWNELTKLMRDQAAAMSHAATERGAKLKSMDAVATMQSYADLAKMHADNMERLSGAFSVLFDSFSAAQKQKADTVFRAKAETHAAATRTAPR